MIMTILAMRAIDALKILPILALSIATVMVFVMSSINVQDLMTDWIQMPMAYLMLVTIVH